MSRACELCGYAGNSGMRHTKRTACSSCIDKVIEFAITAGMRFEKVTVE
jgi:hypothetical protein